MKKISAKKILMETIKELMSVQPLENITVQNILEESGISRPTFYRYFYDKQDLMEFVFKKELAEPFFWDFSKGIKEREILFLRHLASNRSFYLNCLKTEGPNSFYHMWVELAWSSLHDYFAATMQYIELDSTDLVFASKYLAFAWVNMNICWLENSDGITPEEMEQKLSIMMEQGLSGFCKLQSNKATTPTEE